MKHYNQFKAETIIDINNNNTTIMKNILIQFQLAELLTKKSKIKKITFKIIVKTTISVLKILQLYKKQQKDDDVKVIR